MPYMPTSRDHIEKLIDAHTRRLQELELRAATLGSNAPPEVLSEIEDIRVEIAKQQASISAVVLVGELNTTSAQARLVDRRDQLNYDERLHIMVATVQSMVAEFLSLRNFVNAKVDAFENRMNRILIGVLVGMGFLIFLMLYFRGT